MSTTPAERYLEHGPRATMMVQKLLHIYWRYTRPLTLGAQGCVLTLGNEVLLVKHSYRPGWHFPGGGVEKNETALDAVTRELREEAGVIVGEIPRLHGIYSNFKAFPGDHIVLYVVRDWQQPDPPVPNREIVDHGFFPLDNLPEEIHPATRRRLREIVDAAPVAPHW